LPSWVSHRSLALLDASVVVPSLADLPFENQASPFLHEDLALAAPGERQGERPTPALREAPCAGGAAETVAVFALGQVQAFADLPRTFAGHGQPHPAAGDRQINILGEGLQRP